MGAGAPALPALDELGVIDYANSSQRTEALDVFPFGQCHAGFFGGAFGLNQLALTLHKPVCVVNFRPFMFTEWSTGHCLLVPSLLDETATGRILTVEEMLRHPFHVGNLYDEAGLRFVPNDPADAEPTPRQHHLMRQQSPTLLAVTRAYPHGARRAFSCRFV